MSTITFQITSASGAQPFVDQRKHQSSASLAFMRGIHQWPEMFSFNDVIMVQGNPVIISSWFLGCIDTEFGDGGSGGREGNGRRGGA